MTAAPEAVPVAEPEPVIEPEPVPVTVLEPEPAPVVERPVRSRGKTPVTTRARSSQHRMVRHLFTHSLYRLQNGGHLAPVSSKRRDKVISISKPFQHHFSKCKCPHVSKSLKTTARSVSGAVTLPEKRNKNGKIDMGHMHTMHATQTENNTDLKTS